MTVDCAEEQEGRAQSESAYFEDSGEVCRSTFTRTMGAPGGVVKKRVGRRFHGKTGVSIAKSRLHSNPKGGILSTVASRNGRVNL